METFRDASNMTPDREVTVGEFKKILKNWKKDDWWPTGVLKDEDPML
jgi:hypothetical protein